MLRTNIWMNLDDGRCVEQSGNEHGAVLIGYDKNNVTIAELIYDVVVCSKQQFESSFQDRGFQCVPGGIA